MKIVVAGNTPTLLLRSLDKEGKPIDANIIRMAAKEGLDTTIVGDDVTMELSIPAAVGAVLNWESVVNTHDETVYRARIARGWLVKTYTRVFLPGGGEEDVLRAVTFVPDENEVWS
jgi:hypothetical protein